jgi:hypothetical protein
MTTGETIILAFVALPALAGNYLVLRALWRRWTEREWRPFSRIRNSMGFDRNSGRDTHSPWG